MSDYPMLISNKLHSFRNFSDTYRSARRRLFEIAIPQQTRHGFSA